MSDSENDGYVTRANARIGTTVRGKYRIDRVLGMGGMAVVYGATHRNRAEFAIKMLHAELSMHADIRTRFLREGYAANSVKHPGAVAVVDDDVAEDGAAFLVMEMLYGAPGDTILHRNGGRLSYPAVLSIGNQLLDVLAAAHANGLVHRDIKPANLFIAHDGSVKVLDFGIARIRDSASSSATRTGAMLGTPAFMAPEQARGKTNDIDAQTDIWAVGATLFTLLSGQYVHQGENAQQIVIEAAISPCRSVATVVPGMPADIVHVVDRALAYHKRERWPDAISMQTAIRDAYLAHYGSLSDKQLLSDLAGPASRKAASAAMVPTSESGTPTGPRPYKPEGTPSARGDSVQLGAATAVAPASGGSRPPRASTAPTTIEQPSRPGGTTSGPVSSERAPGDNRANGGKKKRADVRWTVVAAVAVAAVAGVSVVGLRTMTKPGRASALAPVEPPRDLAGGPPTVAVPRALPTTAVVPSIESAAGERPSANNVEALVAEPSAAAGRAQPRAVTTRVVVPSARPDAVVPRSGQATRVAAQPTQAQAPERPPTRPAPASAATNAATPPPAPVTTDCTETFYDSNGEKHFRLKPECAGH